MNTSLLDSLGRYFKGSVAAVICANVIFIGTERSDINVTVSSLVLFNLEIVLKLYTYGFKKFFSSDWNR